MSVASSMGWKADALQFFVVCSSHQTMEAFLIGVIALLVWLYPSGADRIARGLVLKSLIYLVIAPVILNLSLGLAMFLVNEVMAIVGWNPFLMFLAWIYWIQFVWAVLFEEAVKAYASRTEPAGIRSFALVSLFGIWELMLFKPLLIELGGQDIIPKAIMLSEPLPAVALHFFTAAIYGFYFRGSPLMQFSLCVFAHLLFNFLAMELGNSTVIYIAGLAFAVATFILVPGKQSVRRGDWIDRQKAALSSAN